VGDSKPYNYLISSIEDFYNQDELLELIKKNKFYKSEYRNLSGGVVAIHSAWKV
jgi:demethylmenaquinone methyltransferase/2-methoxy-6-polyprenyl-1,4-benzoquinol methylase